MTAYSFCQNILLARAPIKVIGVVAAVGNNNNESGDCPKRATERSNEKSQEDDETATITTREKITETSTRRNNVSMKKNVT